MSNECSSEIWKRDFGTPARKTVAVRLADHADDEGRGIWPSVERIAAQCNLSERTVQRTLASFVDEGILLIIGEGGKGPGSTTRYDFDMAAVGRLPLARWKGMKIAKGDTVSPLDKGDTDDTKGDTVSPKGCHGDTQTTIEPPIEPPLERERGREGQENQNGDASAADTPDRAAFEKRVMQFMSGAGFMAGPWPNWDSDGSASPKWVRTRFADLDPKQRLEAERWRDAYLLDMAARKLTPKPVGLFLRDRLWEALDPAILDRAEKQKQARLAPDERATPDGFAKSLGPIGMAALFSTWLDGAASGNPRLPAFVSDARLRDDWPDVWHWRAMLRQKGGMVLSPRWHRLKDAMEAVPEGSPVLAAWKAAFAERGWLWFGEFDRLEVVFCPVGGPDGLGAFERAVRELAN